MRDGQPAARFDLVFLGHYTKDTIVSSTGTRVVDGGAMNYGAHVAAIMGLRTAVITRLAAEDTGVVDQLADLGIQVFAKLTPHSTCLRLDYPSRNPDERTVSVTTWAGPFTIPEVERVDAEIFVIGPSIRGEVGLDILAAIARRGISIAADVQGFLRVARNGKLVHAPWPEQAAALRYIRFLKADAVEAEELTGERDLRSAARVLAGLGPREVVLTHRHGMLVHAEGQVFEAPFRPRTLIGRSGRGDTCIAAYVGCRLSEPPRAATIWAAAATSLKLEAEGPLRRGRAEVEQLVRDSYI
jgi:sugar/nucleoside kinase (ribokinase family)